MVGPTLWVGCGIPLAESLLTPSLSPLGMPMPDRFFESSCIPFFSCIVKLGLSDSQSAGQNFPLVSYPLPLL